MIKERQKTDALSDAAEVPDGATHYHDVLEQFFCLEDGIWYKMLNDSWWHSGAPPFNGLITL
ncbi:MAG: hypothetical protein RR676_11500 [Acinetobacter sp.]